MSEETTVKSVNGWIIIQQRLDGQLNFYLNWTEYKEGFGNMNDSFWFGNEKIHLLTTEGRWKIRFEMMFAAYGWMSAEYYYFSLDNEVNNYTIHLDGYSGDCGDGMIYTTDAGRFDHNNKPFQTYDHVVETYPGELTNCAESHGGGWWYSYCYWVLLNGFYAPYYFSWYTMPAYGLNMSRMMMKIVD